MRKKAKSHSPPQPAARGNCDNQKWRKRKKVKTSLRVDMLKSNWSYAGCIIEVNLNMECKNDVLKDIPGQQNVVQQQEQAPPGAIPIYERLKMEGIGEDT